MELKNFLSFINIKGKIIPLLPFIIGTLFARFKFSKLNILNAFIMFLCVIVIDMLSYGIKNYKEYEKSSKLSKYSFTNYEDEGNLKLRKDKAKIVVIALLILSLVLVFILFNRTNFIVLINGILSIIFAISYSLGPIPINRTLFGEFQISFIAAFINLLTSCFIHLDKTTMELTSFGDKLILSMNYKHIFIIFLLSLPISLAIFNIFLSKNINKMDYDIETNKYTLPILLGKDRSFNVYRINYTLSLIVTILLVLLRVLPFYLIFLLPTYYLIYVNTKALNTKQNRKDKIDYSLRNFFIITIPIILVLLIAIVFKIK